MSERMMGYDKPPERIPPVHKPAKRRQCVWVRGIGWVFNPSRRPMNLGEGDR